MKLMIIATLFLVGCSNQPLAQPEACTWNVGTSAGSVGMCSGKDGAIVNCCMATFDLLVGAQVGDNRPRISIDIRSAGDRIAFGEYPIQDAYEIPAYQFVYGESPVSQGQVKLSATSERWSLTVTSMDASGHTVEGTASGPYSHVIQAQ